MKLFILILFIAFTNFVSGQGAFFVRHMVPYNNQVIAIAECEQGFLAVGKTGGSVSPNGYLYFIDKDGKMIWEQILPAYQPDNYEEYKGVVYSDGFFYIASETLMNGIRFCFIIKMDLEGHVLYKKPLENENGLTSDNTINKILVNEHGLLIVGSGIYSLNSKGLLVQLDFDANFLWQKYFSLDFASPGLGESFIDIKKTKDDNFLLTLWSNVGSGMNHSILKVNELGSEIWRKHFDSYVPSVISQDSLLFLSSTSFKEKNTLVFFNVLTYENIANYPREDFAFIEYDEYGTEINYKRIMNPFALVRVNVFSNKEDDIFITGTRDYSDSLMYKLSVMKFSANLDLEWENYYSKYESNYPGILTGETFKFGMPTSDGGIILSGTDLYFKFGTYFNSSILKTDCEGSLNWNYKRCLSPNFDEITVFPNPTSDEFSIQFPNISPTDKVIVLIFDMTGRLIEMSEFKNSDVVNLSIANLSAGIYNCVIEINGVGRKKVKISKI